MHVVRLGTLCNNACVFCAQAGERARDGEEPSEALAQRAVAEALASDRPVAFVGGEPTLHDDLPGRIARVRDAGVRSVVLQTNARRLAYSAFARGLKAAGLTAIDVSLLGSTEPMHDYHTGTPGSFSQTVRGMRNGQGAGLIVVASCVVTRSNYRNLPDIVKVARAAGALAIRFRFPVLVGKAQHAAARIVAHPGLVKPYLEQARARARLLRMDAFLVGAARDPRQPFVDFLADDASACLQHGQPDDLRSGSIGSDALASRARPAVAEHRARDRRSGSELREILPTLFSPPSEDR